MGKSTKVLAEDSPQNMSLTCKILYLLQILGITGFAGPIMTLVVTPIERMIRLLEILTRDPLGYQTTSSFRKFVEEDYEIAKMTSWSTSVLSGMET
jgi:hypothetical protein